MQIGELSRACGLSCEALRFYERKGLIQARRGENGYRHYAPGTEQLVRYIRAAQQLGFTLAEIGHELPLLWQAPDASQAVRQVLARKLQDLDARIQAMRALREELSRQLGLACPLGRGQGEGE